MHDDSNDIKTVAALGRDHARCIFSTGVCEELTAGQGKLSENGYFAIPCPDCATKMRRKIDGHTDRVLSLVMGSMFR